MGRRLLKEFRCLLIPGLLAMGAAVPMAIRLGFDQATLDVIEPLGLRLLLEIAPSLFYILLAIAASLSYGVEFQYRTLPVLLSQPLSRFTMWREKIFVLGMVVILAALTYTLATPFFHLLGQPWLGSPRQPLNLFTRSALLGGTFSLATVCSAGFWTLLARSTIGGMALSAASQCILLLAVTDVIERVYGPGIPFHDPHNITAVVCAGVIYAAVFQWLGWRRFARLELRFGMTGEVSALPESFAGVKLDLNWLRCRSTGAAFNLVRKEVRLNKPVFLVAAVFSICWLLAVALLLLFPRGRSSFAMILNIMTAIHVPVVFLLAGCASLGEEKSLGLNAWQLTLPIAPARQWLLKLSVGAVIALVLGVLLPWLLSWATALKAEVGLYALAHERGEGMEIVWVGASLILLVSFWASTMLNNTLAAGLLTVIAFPALACSAVLAHSWAAAISGLMESCLSWLIAHFQLSPHYFLSGAWLGGAYFFGLPLSCLLLAQSFAQFRRLQAQGWRSLCNASILAAITFLLFLFQAAFSNAAISISNGVQFELQAAVLALPPSELPPVGTAARSIDLKELEATGRLSYLGKTWLRNSSVSVATSPPPRRGRSIYLIFITFPNGRNNAISIEMPANRTQ